MHEMSLTESMIEIVADTAKAQGFSQVKIVWLEIGALSHAEPEAMRFCFDAVSRGTVVEGAKLEIVAIPGTAWCMACSKPVSIAERYDPCPQCGGYQLQVTGGDDLRVKELEVA